MADIIAEHAYDTVYDCCLCGGWSHHDDQGRDHAAHVAEVLEWHAWLAEEAKQRWGGQPWFSRGEKQQPKRRWWRGAA